MILPEKVWPTQGNGKQNKQKQECLVDNETRGKVKVISVETLTQQVMERLEAQVNTIFQVSILLR